MGLSKDYFATTATLRLLYELNCLKNPQHTLGLAQGEPIYIVPISRTIAAAKRVVFGGICKKLALAPWFRGKYEETLDEVRFKKKGIYIVGGGSQDGHALGLNTLCALVDELNFHGQGKVSTSSASGHNEDKAAMLFGALSRRIAQRFKRHGVKGKIFLISSKRSTQDFTERRIKACAENPDPSVARGVFVRDYAIWDVNPKPYEGQRWYRVAVSPKEGRCKLLEDDSVPASPGAMVFKIPEDVVEEFRTDPDGAARDVAGVSTDFVGRLFIARRRFIDASFDRSRASLFRRDEWTVGQLIQFNWDRVLTKNIRGDPVPTCCPGAVRHVHLDMSKNQCDSGLACLHLAGSVPVFRRDPETGLKIKEEAPVIHVDGVLRAKAPDGDDIDHGEVRGVVYRLISAGIPIRSVSMDQWSAPPNLQMFDRRGLRTEEIGERRFGLKPYLGLRQGFYEGRFVQPWNPVLDKELRELEFDDKLGKVVCPKRGSKDLADALGNAAYYATENIRAGAIPMGPMATNTRPQEISPGYRHTSDGGTIYEDEERERVDDSGKKGNSGGGSPSWIIMG